MANKHYMTPITNCDELYKTVYHDKIETIDNIAPTEDCFRPNMTAQEFAELMVEKHEREDKFTNVFFDFEATTEGKHVAYMCACIDANVIKKGDVFIGSDCGRKMLYSLVNKHGAKDLRLIAHNAGYDLRFLYHHISQIQIIDRSKMLLRAYGKFYYEKGKYINIQIQDSYAFIANKLSEFDEIFKLPIEKEILPYSMYTPENIKTQFLDYDTCRKYCDIQFDSNNIVAHGVAVKGSKQEYFDMFIANANKWGCLRASEPLRVDIIKYSAEYCLMDCKVLKAGYETFHKWINDVCKLDINCFVSLPSLADAYLISQGVFEGVEKVGSIVRAFIQRCMVGGRTMCANNKKNHIVGKIDDFDAVSLYPSAMVRLGGYLRGRAKVLTSTDYDTIKKYDGYFIEIKVTKVGKGRTFPLASYTTDEGVRDFTNDIVGRVLYVDKIMLEDLIEYQNIEFEIIRGYYYDEGRNNKLREVIQYLFNTRLKAKKDKNPIETTYKLIMNAAYGKTLLKPFDDETKYVPQREYQKFVYKYYNHIKEITKIPAADDAYSSYRIKLYKPIDKHFNNCIAGIEVLSMSKRIMNEVMTLAEDSNLNIYYQDTDSMHIDSVAVAKLAAKYEAKYGRELIGKGLGQFHSDFKSKVIKSNIQAIESVFLGKKCYIDKLEGLNDKGETVYDYHVRMKGVSGKAIDYYSHKNKIDLITLYKKLHDGKSVDFDLCCDGLAVNFDFRSDMSIHSNKSFVRTIQFFDNDEDKKEAMKARTRAKGKKIDI